MLTRQQSRLLDFVYGFQRAHGYTPSHDEIKEGIGLRSKSSVHRLILALTERGFIRRLPHRARAIEIIRRAA